MNWLILEIILHIDVTVLLQQHCKHNFTRVQARKVQWRHSSVRSLFGDWGCMVLLSELLKFEDITVKLVKSKIFMFGFLLDNKLKHFYVSSHCKMLKPVHEFLMCTSG